MFLVNRLGHVQLKGNLEKKIAIMNLEEIVQNEDAMAKEFCEEQNFKVKKENWERKKEEKNCVEISFWWKNCNKEIWHETHKLKFWQNSITQVVT